MPCIDQLVVSARRLVSTLVPLAIAVVPATGQQVRPRGAAEVPVQSPSGTAVQSLGSSAPSFSTGDAPQTNLAPIARPSIATPPASSFDPYAMSPESQGGGFPAPANPGVIPAPLPSNAGSAPAGTATIGPPTPVAPYPQASGGGIAPSAPGSSLFSRIFSQPASSPQLNAPIYGAPQGGTFGNNLGPATTYPPPSAYAAPPAFPNSAYPSNTPSTLFPGGVGGMLQPAGPVYRAYRLLQGPRLRHAWVMAGDDPDDLETNDTDASLVFAFPNFLYSTQPLYVIPSFSLHLWDGPKSSIGADLPSSAYSGFIDVGWNSDPMKMLSTELGVRVGAFTDFDTFNSDSIRILGKGLVNFRWTPTSTLKAGAYYLDRNDIKLVPAGGILYQPNPNTRYDLFFPQPKLSHYWRTLGTKDVWWYLAGDYGGGSWTIERANGTEDSIDINELRVLLGIEAGDSAMLRAGKRTAFFEVGYAFEREVEYRYNPEDNFKPDDGLLLRAGIGY